MSASRGEQLDVDSDLGGGRPDYASFPSVVVTASFFSAWHSCVFFRARVSLPAIFVRCWSDRAARGVACHSPGRVRSRLAGSK